MPETHADGRPADHRPGRLSALTTLVAFLIGIVVFLPWDSVWNFGLHRLAGRLPAGVRLRWQGVDRAGPLGCRVNGLAASGPGWPFAPMLASLDVRLGMSPRLVLTADTGGGVLTFLLLDDGRFVLSGTAGLSCLGRRDIEGRVNVRCEGRGRLGPARPERAFLDLRGRRLKLPGGLFLGDAALALEYGPAGLRIRSFSLRTPVQVRASGSAALVPGAFLASPYAVKGEIFRRSAAVPFTSQGRLSDFLGGADTPR